MSTREIAAVLTTRVQTIFLRLTIAILAGCLVPLSAARTETTAELPAPDYDAIERQMQSAEYWQPYISALPMRRAECEDLAHPYVMSSVTADRLTGETIRQHCLMAMMTRIARDQYESGAFGSSFESRMRGVGNAVLDLYSSIATEVPTCGGSVPCDDQERRLIAQAQYTEYLANVTAAFVRMGGSQDEKLGDFDLKEWSLDWNAAGLHYPPVPATRQTDAQAAELVDDIMQATRRVDSDRAYADSLTQRWKECHETVRPYLSSGSTSEMAWGSYLISRCLHAMIEKMAQVYYSPDAFGPGGIAPLLDRLESTLMPLYDKIWNARPECQRSGCGTALAIIARPATNAIFEQVLKEMVATLGERRPTDEWEKAWEAAEQPF